MLQIDNLVFDAWGRRFFNEASVAIPPGSKVGLVGRNGIGKSTLFKLITGELVPLGGEILLPKRARIGSVDQEHPATPVTLIDTILAADTLREELTAQLETAEPEEMAEIYQQLNAIDADRAPARAAEILNGLGFSTEDLDPDHGGILRRLAHARRARRRLVRRARSVAARRADQLSRSRRRAVARGAAEEISAYRLDRQPRPRASQQFGRHHPASERGQARPLQRQLRRFRAPPRREGAAAIGDQGEAGGRARAFAEIHRPLPRQGQQGGAGAIAHQASGQDGADRGGGRGARRAVHAAVADAAVGAAADSARERRGRL